MISWDRPGCADPGAGSFDFVVDLLKSGEAPTILWGYDRTL